MRFAALFLLASALWAQYIPGRGGGGFVYTGALSGIPATCSVGQIAFITDATPGQNQYNCAATNTWTQNLNSGAGGANTALSNLVAPALNLTLLPSAAGARNLGTAALPFGDVFIGGVANQSFDFLTTGLTANRQYTAPDLAGTLTLNAGNLLTANQIPNVNASLLLGGTNLSWINATGILQIGGVTSASPAIKKSGAVAAFRLADDSADAAITASLFNKYTLTTPATGVTITIADGKTLTLNNTITFAGTDSTTMTFPTTSATIARTDAAQTFTGTQTYSGLIDASGGNFKMPTGAGFAATSTNMFGYDSTNTNPHIWDGADGILAPFASAPTTGRCVQTAVVSGKITLVDSGSTNCGGGGATALSAVTAAAAGNTIANGDNAQVWNWATTTAGKIGFTFGETTASTSTGTPYLVKLTTLIGSTAIPLNIANSLNGSQTLAALSITPTWNTTGVVDAALLINPTNTASGTASKLIDAQVGGTTQWNVDKAGNTVQVGSITTGSGSGVAGAFQCGQGTAATVASNSFGWTCPTTMTTSVLLQSPNAVPAANQVMLFPAPTSNISQWTWTGFTSTNLTDTANLVRNNGANTGAAAMTLDMSGATGATAFKVPVIAGATAGADGVIDYDSTNKNTHIRANGADAIAGAFASAPATGNLVSATVSSSNVLLADSGVVAANAVTATSAATAAGQVCTSGGATKTCSYIDFPERFYVPAANCNNATAGAAFSIGSGGTVQCRAGTNNLGGNVLISDTASTFATLQFPLPEDWNTGSNPFVRFFVSSTDVTSGHTIIPSIQVACYKGDGTTTDDVAANAAHSSSTVTLNTTNHQFWSNSNVQMNSTDVTGCVAGALMQVTLGRATDTATNATFYGFQVTIPRRLVVQAN